MNAPQPPSRPDPAYELDLGEPEAPAAPAPRPVPVPVPVPAAAPAPAPSDADADADADLKPGSRKDLWPCPHCGAGNQPKRTTCRACGRSPDEPVAPPWWRTPAGMAGLAALPLALLLAWWLTRPDLSLHPAGAAGLDRAVRTGGGGGAALELGERTFAPDGRLAVCGRVLRSEGAAGAPGFVSVTLVLGPQALDEASWEDPAGLRTALLHCRWPEGAAPRLERGAWLSLAGRCGLLTEGVALIPALREGRTVLVDALVQP